MIVNDKTENHFPYEAHCPLCEVSLDCKKCGERLTIAKTLAFTVIFCKTCWSEHEWFVRNMLSDRKVTDD